MFVRLSKTFHFEAAHDLPTFPADHKCRRLHGHSFRFDVIVEGEVVISHEHSGYRWLAAKEFRSRYFSDEMIALADANEARIGAIVRGVRDNLDEYLARRGLV